MSTVFDEIFNKSNQPAPSGASTMPPQAPKEGQSSPISSEPEKPVSSDPKKTTAKKKKEPEMTESEKAEAKKYADEITEDAAQQKQLPKLSKRKELEDMVALMVYEMDMNADSAVLLVDKMKIALDMVQDITKIEKTMPPDCVEIMQETTAIIEGYTRKKDPTTNPADVVASQRMAIGFKHRLGEIGAYYKANSLGREAQYYGLRGALFVSLREIGHSLESNIKKGKTVTDIENQAQMLTIPMMKQRVYATWVWERINNQLRTLSEVIKNMDSYVVELRAQRREDSLPQR